jgi:DNA recombination protein RmuC
LETVKRGVGEIERQRQAQYGQLQEQMRSVSDTQRALQLSTNTLAGALKSSSIRGSWGEIELERILQLSGLQENIAYAKQSVIEGGGRPDVNVKLPGDKNIAIDAKSSMSAYLRAKELESQINDDPFTQDDYNKNVQAHAAALRKHINDLHKKEYWNFLAKSPDFTIMFIPNEASLEMALHRDPTLLDYAFDHNVIITTPTSLLGVLKSVAAIWKHFNFEQDALELQKLGQSLYDNFKILTNHMVKLGKSIGGSMDNYNAMVSSYQSRFLNATVKIKNIDTNAIVSALPPIEKETKTITKPDLLDI